MVRGLLALNIEHTLPKTKQTRACVDVVSHACSCWLMDTAFARLCKSAHRCCNATLLKFYCVLVLSDSKITYAVEIALQENTGFSTVPATHASRKVGHAF